MASGQATEVTMSKKRKRLAAFKRHVEYWRDRLGISDFDIYVEQGTLDDGTLADVTRDVDSRSCVIRLHAPPDGDDDLDHLSSLARHEMIHVLLADLSALAHSREATHAEIERAEEALVVRLTRLL